MSIKKKFINEIVDVVIEEISNENTQNKLSTYVIEPGITYLFHRMYPYILITFVIFILILVMAVIIIFLLVRKEMKYNI